MPENADTRRVRRASWPVRVYRLGEEPGDDLSGETNATQRVELVWELTARAWVLTGQPTPAYDRPQMPIRIIRTV